MFGDIYYFSWIILILEPLGPMTIPILRRARAIPDLVGENDILKAEIEARTYTMHPEIEWYSAQTLGIDSRDFPGSSFR